MTATRGVALLFLSSLSIAVAAAERPKSMTADVLIRADGRSIVIAAERRERQNIVDDVFRFRADREFAPLEIAINRAHVEIDTHRLLISAPELQRAFVFELTDAARPEPWFPPLFEVTRFRGGYELSRRTVQREEGAVAACCPEDENLDPGDGDWGATMTCDSGGKGSTSCSVEAYTLGSGGSCSTSCANGYYACCSLTKGCKCIKY